MKHSKLSNAPMNFRLVSISTNLNRPEELQTVTNILAYSNTEKHLALIMNQVIEDCKLKKSSFWKVVLNGKGIFLAKDTTGARTRKLRIEPNWDSD